MKKEEIIKIAEDLGFHLNYDQFDIVGKEWMRFQLPDELDERDLRWIWYKNESYIWNMERGLYIQARGKKKAAIQEFLKY